MLILFLGVILIALSLVSMWKENRQGEPLNGIISFALAVMGFCAFALLAGYV
jgi:cell division protein FtsL